MSIELKAKALNLEELFPKERADQFFEALYGDSSEGAYDIQLIFKGIKDSAIMLEFHLKQRPGKCLACSLTYGLPQVFERHPIINIKGLAKELGDRLGKGIKGYRLGHTREISNTLHIIPFEVFFY